MFHTFHYFVTFSVFSLFVLLSVASLESVICFTDFSFFGNFNKSWGAFCGIKPATTYLPSSLTKLNTVHALCTGTISVVMPSFCTISRRFFRKRISYTSSNPMIKRSGFGTRMVNSDKDASFMCLPDSTFQHMAYLGKSIIGPITRGPVLSVNPVLKIKKETI